MVLVFKQALSISRDNCRHRKTSSTLTAGKWGTFHNGFSEAQEIVPEVETVIPRLRMEGLGYWENHCNITLNTYSHYKPQIYPSVLILGTEM
jgi:hypothetical protein